MTDTYWSLGTKISSLAWELSQATRPQNERLGQPTAGEKSG